jgi:hypothetical protein
MIEQALCGLEDFIGHGESRVGMAVQVDDIFRNRARTVRG